MRILLLGAGGFLGSHLLARLTQVTDADIHAVTRGGRGRAGVTWHHADLRDEREPDRIVREVAPTHIIGNAWTVTPGKFWTDPANLDWVASYYSIFGAISRLNHPCRFVGVGTCAEYDWNETEFIEDRTRIAPRTPYGKAKAITADAALRLPSAAWGRVFLPYGPLDTPGRLLPSVMAALRRGEEIDLTSGRQLRDFTYAEDIADFFVMLTLSEATGAFNVGTGVGTPVRRVVESLADAMDADRRLLLFGARPDGNEPPSLVADTNKVRNTLGWTPRWSLDAGISRLVSKEEAHAG